MTDTTNPFQLLRDRKIISILNGDVDFGELSKNVRGEAIKISMPYLSGPELCSISSYFGLSVNYSWSGGAKSRWEYMDNLIEHCIKGNRMSDLLAYLFSKKQFIEKLQGNSPDVIEISYDKIVETVIKQINSALYFGGNELVVVGNYYVVRKIGTTVTINTPKIKVIDRNYISELSTRALKNVDNQYYDSAITQSRTLLEEVFCYVIEKKNVVPSDKGDIGKLYKQVKELYNMHNDNNMDKRINTLLSGLEKIVSSIAEMRNKASDSHGVGAKRINIADHHARLYVNASMTMADFILSVAEKQS